MQKHVKIVQKWTKNFTIQQNSTVFDFKKGICFVCKTNRLACLDLIWVLNNEMNIEHLWIIFLSQVMCQSLTSTNCQYLFDLLTLNACCHLWNNYLYRLSLLCPPFALRVWNTYYSQRPKTKLVWILDDQLFAQFQMFRYSDTVRNPNECIKLNEKRLI